MHIPVFSALAANTRWNNGAPDLMTMDALRQAAADAPYWEKELRAGNMLTMDEGYHLQAFRFLSFVHHEGFWDALVGHLGQQTPTFWLPALDSAIEAGNLHALNALTTKGQYTLQALFFEWLAFVEQTQGATTMLHPNTLAWFAQDPTLHTFMNAFGEACMQRDYTTLLLKGEDPPWWDVPSKTGGVQALLERNKAWCALDAPLFTLEGAVKTAIQMLVSLNKSDMDADNNDPKRIHRQSPASLALRSALETCVTTICERASIPQGLIRTLAGRMNAQDREDPMLCAVAQFEDPHVRHEPYCTAQQRAPLSVAHYRQIQNNASFAEPLPTLLDMEDKAIRGLPWRIYCIAEPFVSRRPVQTMALPENLLSAD